MLKFLDNRANLSLVISVAFSLLLIGSRMIYTGSIHYFFLVWNLVLAAIPYAIITALSAWRISHGQFAFWPMMTLWLLFLPNAPYITTDFLHLRYDTGGVAWFDALLTLSFAFNGLFLFFLALQPVQAMVAPKSSVLVTWGFVGGVTALTAFGIYIGRFLRLNSWDALLAPVGVLSEIWDRLADPFSHPRTWAMTALYTGFLLVTYYLLWTLMRSEGRSGHSMRTAAR